MRAIQAWWLVVAVSLAGCEKNRPKGDDATQSDIVVIDKKNAADLVDHTEQFKGKTVRITARPVIVSDKTIRDLDKIELYTTMFGPKVQFVAMKPAQLTDVPAAKSGDEVVVTFRCADGSLTQGNEIVSITRQ